MPQLSSTSSLSPAGIGHNGGPPAAWTPQEGSQVDFLTCPIYEVLYEGTRGPGKTDALLMDFCQHVGVGWGEEWSGILFRQTYKQLDDVIKKSKKWFKRFWPTATFNKQDKVWEFPDGERLALRHMDDPDDYENYHGHAYPWIAWEELTLWKDDRCYTVMMSCSRSTVGPDKRDRYGRQMPRKYRATTNPYGVGHNWVKRRFRLPHMRGKVIRDSIGPDGKLEPPRVAIYGHLSENRILLDAEPDYVQKITAAARNKAELAAWRDGSWDITSGGMFDDLWDSNVHVVKPFKIPATWRLDRSYDHGSSKPFSCGIWAQSDGSDYVDHLGRRRSTVRGDLFRVAEVYGCQAGQDNVGVRMEAREIAKEIKETVQRLRDGGWIRGYVAPGPADNAIWTQDNGPSIAQDMLKEGVSWTRSDKGAGSRKQGWELIRKMLKSAAKKGFREDPGLFVFDTCEGWIRTVPSLPRDDRNPDDVNTKAEDHAADETRYRIRRKPGARQGQM